MTPGTRPERRVRRAAPLPNSDRGSALMRTSATEVLLGVVTVVAVDCGRVPPARGDGYQPTASMTDRRREASGPSPGNAGSLRLGLGTGPITAADPAPSNQALPANRLVTEPSSKPPPIARAIM